MSDDTNNDNNSSNGNVQTKSNVFDLNTVIEQAKKVILNPQGFYREMPTSGGYAEPIIFLVVMTVITVLIGFIFSLIGLAKFNPVVGGAVTIGMIIITPIFAIIGSFIGAAILFVIWKLMGSEKDYETAYRCLAYSTAIGPIIAAISFIPYIANIIKTLWGCFLMYTASVEVQKVSAKTAMIVFGVLAGIAVLMGIGTERTARNFQSTWGDFSKEMERSIERNDKSFINAMEDMEDMTPEEAGKKVGEFLKGMEQFSKGLEESVKESEQE